jgi:stage V sporulation protein G
MEITEVVVRPVESDRLKAYVSLTFDHVFVIKDIKIVEGRNGLFVSMPSRRRKDGKYQDIAHPINSDFRKMVEDCIFSRYEEMMGNLLTGKRELSQLQEQEREAV